MAGDWFDDAYYASQKVAQMNAMHWRGKTDWDEAGYRAELANYGVTARENFEACNTANYASGISLAAVNVSPNEFFDVGVYVQNFVNWANGPGAYSNGAIASGQWTVQNMLAHIFNDLHMSIWAHYQEVGMELLLNPSNKFSTASYFAAKASAMNRYVNPDGAIGFEGKTDWKAADVLAQLQDSGENPIENFFDTGKPQFNVQAQAPAVQTVVDVSSGWSPWGEAVKPEPVKPVSPAIPGSAGSGSGSGSGRDDEPDDPFDDIAATVVLTADKSEYSGAAGENTLFIGKYMGAETGDTVQPAYVIDGGADSANILKMELGASWPGFEAGEDGPNVVNIGRLQLEVAEEAQNRVLNFNARNIDGLQRVEVANIDGGGMDLTGLDAENLKVVQSGGVVQPVVSQLAIDGSITNLDLVFDHPEPGKSGEDPIDMQPHVTAVATGDVNITVANYARITGGSSFAFADAEGDVNVNVTGEVPDHWTTWGGYGNDMLQFNAAKARNFTLVSNGALGPDDIYTVVNDESVADGGAVAIKALGRGVTLPGGASLAAGDHGMTLNAAVATTLDIESISDFKIKAGDLGSVRELNVKLTKSNADDPDPRANSEFFDMNALDLPMVEQVAVQADGMDVKLGNLGHHDDGVLPDTSELKITVENSRNLEIDGIYSQGAVGIDFNISDHIDISSGEIRAGGHGSRANLEMKVVTNDGGNLDGKNANHLPGEAADPGVIDIVAKDITLDVALVDGMVSRFGLVAQDGVIDYEGSTRHDEITVFQVGKGNSSLNLGSGDDCLWITLGENSLAAGEQATIDITLGFGDDYVHVSNVERGTLVVKVNDFRVWADEQGEIEDGTIQTSGSALTEDDRADVIQVLKDAGFDSEFIDDLVYCAPRADSGEPAAWYSASSKTGYFVDGTDAVNGITIIAVDHIEGLQEMQNVFGSGMEALA